MLFSSGSGVDIRRHEDKQIIFNATNFAIVARFGWMATNLSPITPHSCTRTPRRIGFWLSDQNEVAALHIK